VPFCLSVCPYCDFVVYGGRLARRETGVIGRFLAAVTAEIRLRGELIRHEFGAPKESLRSVYIGGGTPSLLAASELADVLAAADDALGIAADAEITLEANPAPRDRGDLRGFRAAGVNRVSFGVQSLDANELRTLGRRHSAADVESAAADARAAGLENVSLDLLYDVPGQTDASWTASLRGAVALGPEHVSAYALDLADPDGEGLTGTLGDHLAPSAGARRWRERARTEQDDDRAARHYEMADELLRAAGFDRYELSNWARTDRESRHNLAYWTGAAWEGVGPGAHAYDGALARRWNGARLDGYLEALLGSQASLPPGDLRRLPAPRLVSERALLGLRLASGIPGALAEHADVAPVLAWGLRNGLIERGPAAQARLTAQGRLLSNEVFARLL
jgi:oxygen-independent coproporphyrinogen-3 oxidase